MKTWLSQTVLGLTLTAIAQTGNVGAATWDGDGGNNLASTAANWDGDAAPAAGDAIVLNASSSKNMTWDLNIPVASWTQDGYTGTVTVATVYGAAGFTNLQITGDCTLASGCWTHQAQPANNTAQYRLRADVGGNLTLGAAARIDVTGRGFPQGYGPGTPGTTGWGASYGGRGSSTTPATPRSAPCYGSVTAPADPGSGGNNSYGKAGGGAVWLTVGGALQLDGEIVANAAPGSSYYSGTGGSVYCRAGAIRGGGAVRANAGAVANTTPGGGGRIALVATNAGAGWDELTGTVEANGFYKTYSSSSGTIYRERAADPPGAGELIIHGHGQLPDYALGAEIGGQTAATGAFSRVTLENAGVLVVTAGSRIDLSQGTVSGMPGLPAGGIALGGGTLEAPSGFILTNAFLRVQAEGSALLSSGSFTVGSNGEFRVDQPLAYAGDLNIAAGGLVSHTDGGAYRIDLAVAGDLAISSGGAIDVSRKGYPYKQGPGRGDGGIGASHGGRGASNVGVAMGLPSYGSITAPVTCGSGGGYQAPSSGGGAIRLDVAGTVFNNGLIAANGEDRDYYSASGGSVWLTAGALTGDGPVQANGGRASNQTQGAGGRVAVTVTNAGAKSSTYAGTISAWSGGGGGTRVGGAGTVYLRDAGQEADEGTLIVDNNNRVTTERWTEIVPSVEGRSFGSVILRNGGRLRLDTDETIQVSGVWSNGTDGFVAEPGATVVLAGDGADDAALYGNSTFDGLICATPGKTVRFAAGSRTRVVSNGLFRIAGATGAPVALVSTAPGTVWELDADANARQEVRHAAVADSDARAGAEITDVNGRDDGGNDNWRFLDAPPGQQIIWTGAAGTGWSDRRNWNLDRTPVPEDAVSLPAGCPRYPVLDVAIDLNRLEVAAGASLALAGFDLAVTNRLEVAGRLTASGGERLTLAGDASFGAGTFDAAWSEVVFSGSAAQTAACGGNRFGNVRVAKSGGSLQVLGGLTAAEWRAEAAAGAPAVALSFAAGETVVVQRLLLAGDTASPNILLGSTSPGTAWNLRLTGYRSVSGVSVSDSDAAAGLAVLAADSVDGGNNANWLFGAAPVQWVGGSGSSFHTAANWSSGQVPDAGTRVAVSVAAPLVISQAAAVRELVVGGGDVAASVSANAPLTVGEALTVLDQGTLSLNKPCVVSNGFAILDGGLLTHAANAADEANKIDLTVLGDADIEAGGMIDVRAKGYAINKGPGAPGTQGGGSHGGRGVYTALTAGACYGSIAAPTNLGSGGYWYPGGGAVRLTVAGALRHNGEILANASVQVQKHGVENDHYTGAGGSVFITADSLLGDGAVRANGGHYMGNYGGGGGRIALVVTGAGADFTGFTGETTAFGGRMDGYVLSYKPAAGAGTIFMRCPADGPRRGTFRIDNDGGLGANFVTDLPPDAQWDPREVQKVRVRVERGATLRLTADATVGDLWLEDANTRLNLNSKTLTIRSREHTLAPGAVLNYGTIIWLPEPTGSVILLR